MNTITLCWINFYKWSYIRCLAEIESKISDKTTALIVTPNPEMLYEASRDAELHSILAWAEYALPDGAWIFVAYQARKSTLPTVLKYIAFPYWCIRAIFHTGQIKKNYGERITGSRITRDILRFAEGRGISVTIIDPIVHGNSRGDKLKRRVQEKMETRLRTVYPNLNLNIIISDTAPQDITRNGIVLATHGNGKQEKLLSQLIQNIPNAWVTLGIWGSIDIITGFRKSAPWLLQRFGLEWLYRLIQHPSRHAKRMRKVLSFLWSCLKK